MPEMITPELTFQRVHLGERLGRSRHPRQRDSAVEAHDGRRVVRQQQIVEREHLQPVGRRRVSGIGMARGDRGLQLPPARDDEVAPRARARHAHRRGARHPISSGPAREAARVRPRPRAPIRGRDGIRTQGEQSLRLGLARQRRRDHSGKPQRIVGEVAIGGGVAAGDRCASLYMTDTTVSTMSRRSARSAGSGIRSGMPAAPILRLARTIRCATVASGAERRAGDLGGREPADGAERECKLRVRRKGGVAAAEQQRQSLIGLDIAPEQLWDRRSRARQGARASRDTATRAAAGRAHCAARPG